MKIAIIGWYGTETIGDRAILAGLLSVFSEAFGKFELLLGSLNPVFTERTVYEDISFYRKCAENQNISISIFDSQKASELRKAIRKCDMLAIGGGPLMDLIEMRMLDYAFVYAKRKKKPTALLGCGWGPLKERGTIDIAKRLVSLADLSIFRDNISKQQCQYNGLNGVEMHALIDPAFFACDRFLQIVDERRYCSFVAVNLRDVQVEANHYAQGNYATLFSEMLKTIVGQLNLPIKLIPMHNFNIGGDDRVFLDKVMHACGCGSVSTIWETLSLYDTMLLYYHAKYCFGMRFHSVVLQSYLNGNNYIIDYTDPQSGKTIGMLRQLNLWENYQDRYFSLFDSQLSTVDFKLSENRTCAISKDLIAKYKKEYVQLLKAVI